MLISLGPNGCHPSSVQRALGKGWSWRFGNGSVPHCQDVLSQSEFETVLKQQLWLLFPFTGIAQWSEACVGSGNPAPHTAGMGKAAWHHPSAPPVLPPQHTVLLWVQ